MMQETKDVAILVAKIANGVSEAMKDGKIGIDDILAFGPAAAAFPAAISSCGDIVEEVKNATDADKDDLVNAFCTEFSISNAQAEAMVEKTLEILVAIWKFLK